MTAAVLAGGKSKRFGSDKLLQPFFGKTVIERVVEALSPFNEVLIITKNPPKLPSTLSKNSKVKLITEIFTEQSPLYGLFTALKHATFDKVLIVPGDAPLFSPLFLYHFARMEAPAFIVENGRKHPLICILKKIHITAVEELIKENMHKVAELHKKINSKEVNFDQFKVFDYRKKSLINVNRKEDFYEALYR
ncbi:molybdenum cofactor guanylyltransferase [Desulfurobacterium pacificum]|uniref:molybdenum cofactor guanylyltransferase n=1 Tax=Desulfurobacterium pacificum TaxID=240166 RepID=UPI0024B6A42D|nr:molybdenum cofactor guanylyltransferase [Desulfurobacterium pacificum]